MRTVNSKIAYGVCAGVRSVAALRFDPRVVASATFLLIAPNDY